MSRFPFKCPYCDFQLDDGDIYERFLEFGKTEDAALEIAKLYGWTEENKERFSKILAVYDYKEDRTDHYECPECKKTIDLEN